MLSDKQLVSSPAGGRLSVVNIERVTTELQILAGPGSSVEHRTLHFGLIAIATQNYDILQPFINYST